MWVRLLVALTVSLYAAGAAADDFDITPSIAVRQEYNDNIFFDDEDEEDDLITTVKPGLEITNRSERINFSLKGEVSPFFYWDNDELDDVDQDYSSRLNYMLTERLRFNGSASLRYDNRPDRDILTTGLSLESESRRQQRYNAGFDYSISETINTGITGGYRRDDFMANTDPDDEDWKAWDAGFSYTHDISRWFNNTIGRLNLGYSNYDFETSETDYYYGTVGFQRQVTELFNLLIDIGARYTDSDFEVQQLVIVPPGIPTIVASDENDSSIGGVAQAVLEYRGLKTRGNILASHDIDAASGRRGAVQRSRFVLNGGYLLQEKLRIGLTAGVYYNQSDDDEFAQDEIDEFVYRLRPNLRWEFYDNFTLETAYAYTYVDDKTVDGDSQQHLVYAQLAFGYPLFDLIDIIGSPGGLNRIETEIQQVGGQY